MLLAIVLLLLMMIEPFRLISVAQTLTLNWREEDSRMPMDNAREEELRVRGFPPRSDAVRAAHAYSASERHVPQAPLRHHCD